MIAILTVGIRKLINLFLELMRNPSPSGSNWVHAKYCWCSVCMAFFSHERYHTGLAGLLRQIAGTNDKIIQLD